MLLDHSTESSGDASATLRPGRPGGALTDSEWTIGEPVRIRPQFLTLFPPFAKHHLCLWSLSLIGSCTDDNKIGAAVNYALCPVLWLVAGSGGCKLAEAGLSPQGKKGAALHTRTCAPESGIQASGCMSPGRVLEIPVTACGCDTCHSAGGQASRRCTASWEDARHGGAHL